MKTIDRQKITLLLVLFLVLLTFGMTLKAQLPSPPNPPRLVNDYTNTLSISQINALEHKLVAYNDSTSTQLLVLLVDDLQGYDIHEYSTKIGHSWGVGQKGKNNGVVITIKPKKGSERGFADVCPGYGMEEYVTDATSKRIVEKEMIPAFKENDYYTGINNAVNVIMDLCSGKFTQDEYDHSDEGFPLWLIILFIIAIVIILSKFSDNNGQSYSGGGHRTIWIPMGGFGSGGFGGGGSFGGGGGFGGFGGGGFGGGGASGSW